MTELENSDQGLLTQGQIFAILKRINYPLDNPDVLPEPTLETLQELQLRCVTSIPFETFSLRMTKSRVLDISLQGVYDRIVNNNRGGLCFSLNLLGFELLKGIGYTVDYVLGRVCKSMDDNDDPVYGGFIHRTSIVQFEDGTRYAFDIGFGPTHSHPIELRDGAEIDCFGFKRRMVKVTKDDANLKFAGSSVQDLWQMDDYIGDDKWKPAFTLTIQPFSEIDCEIGNHYTCLSPNSVLFSAFWCMQGTLDGVNYILIDKELKIKTSTGTKEKITFETEKDRLDALEKYFGIILTEDELLHHDQKIE
ncbi:N-terminal acetyltransferase [Entomortierella beljakovae]|nr:N-terminal acetyltransferase [Entomortierella beljakovae]